MFIKELWRYPIKSMAGERVRESRITLAGIPGDRAISIVDPRRRIITSRTHHRLLGLKGDAYDQWSVDELLTHAKGV